MHLSDALIFWKRKRGPEKGSVFLASWKTHWFMGNYPCCVGKGLQVDSTVQPGGASAVCLLNQVVTVSSLLTTYYVSSRLSPFSSPTSNFNSHLLSELI